MTGATLESNQAAGTRLELLLFGLGSPQKFGINVFKVQEILPYRQLTALPGSHAVVNGIANLRGITMGIIDLSKAIGGPPTKNIEQSSIIVTEYNRSVHGFLVDSVDRIVHTQWESVTPPPMRLERHSYVTAVTIIDGDMIEILDVEKVLDEVVQASTTVSSELTQEQTAHGHRVLIVDDSSVARNQVQRSLEQIGVECTVVMDGKEALSVIDDLEAMGHELSTYFSMVVSDIEMPEMDGYMLTTALRKRESTQHLYVLLHSSISGEFNMDMVAKTGANRFIQKYNPDDLACAVLEHLESLQ